MKTFHCIKCTSQLATQGDPANPKAQYCPNEDCDRFGLVTVASDLKEAESG